MFIFFCLLGHSQDVIERDYFPGARAKNSAIAAARYAEEGYYYVKFTTYVNAVDSSRLFADTALFFIKRSIMLADTSLHYAGSEKQAAIDFLKSGIYHSLQADSIVREYYPMTDIRSHNTYGIKAALNSSQSVMEYYNASLLFTSEDSVPSSENQRYKILAYQGEVIRLEADEASFLNLSSQLEKEILTYENLITGLSAEIDKSADQKSRAMIRGRLDLIKEAKGESTSHLQKVSEQLQQIRELLDANYLSEVRNIKNGEQMSQFETERMDYYENKTVQIDAKNPDGLVYKIQLGYYPKSVDKEKFYGLFPITGETVGDDLVRFFAGMFYTYEDASKGKDYIKQNAIANAFIVPYYNGKKINCSQAIQLELQRASQ